MKKLIFLLALTTHSLLSASQDSLDELLSSINNKDLYITQIHSNPWGEKLKGIDKDSARASKRLFIVSSLNEDIQAAAKKFTKKALLEKLKLLLNDPNKDLYANALLYDLFDNRKLGKLINLTRDEWTKSGRRDLDIKHWQEFRNSK